MTDVELTIERMWEVFDSADLYSVDELSVLERIIGESHKRKLTHIKNNINSEFLEDESEMGLYRMNVDYGRQGNINGVFIVPKEYVEKLLEGRIGVYFGEILGKHSEVFCTIKEDEIVLLSDDVSIINLISSLGLTNGYNPFLCSTYGVDDNDEDLDVGDYIEMILNSDYVKEDEDVE